jgi:HD-GYP domain-containing protein (c-di-GMP phosphodiesterase class II)
MTDLFLARDGKGAVPVRMPERSLLRRRARAQQDERAHETRWNARPLIALSLRAVMSGVPALAAVSVVIFLEHISAAPTTWPARIVTWSLLLGVSAIVALVVERRLRSLLPLALLMRMTLVFPDEAPSRYAVARAANSPAKIKELAATGSSPRAQAAAEVLALVARLAKHDRHTRGHSERVRVFTDLIAEQMGVSGPDRDKLAWGALLHDIGKMNVPGELLNKPGKPTPHEWEVLKKHPLAGGEFAGPLAEWLGPWIGGITQHHERFDGKGYPLGVAAQDISLAGRIVAVADAYETMTAARSYKKPMTVAAARQELTDCAGAHFDPVVVRAFLALSLPRLMWGVGPLSFLAHLPFVARAEVVSVKFAAASSAAAPAAAAAAVGAASVVTAGAVVPTAPPAPHPAQVTVADTTNDSGNSVEPAGAGGAAFAPTDLPKPTTAARPVNTAPGSARAPAAVASPTTPNATGKGAGNGNGNGGQATGSPGKGNSANSNGSSGNSNSGNSNSGNSNSGNSNSGNDNSGNGGSGKGSSAAGSGTLTSSTPGSSTSESVSSNSGKGSSYSGQGKSGQDSSDRSGKKSAPTPAPASS